MNIQILLLYLAARNEHMEEINKTMQLIKKKLLYVIVSLILLWLTKFMVKGVNKNFVDV